MKTECQCIIFIVITIIGLEMKWWGMTIYLFILYTQKSKLTHTPKKEKRKKKEKALAWLRYATHGAIPYELAQR